MRKERGVDFASGVEEGHQSGMDLESIYLSSIFNTLTRKGLAAMMEKIGRP